MQHVIILLFTITVCSIYHYRHTKAVFIWHVIFTAFVALFINHISWVARAKLLIIKRKWGQQGEEPLRYFLRRSSRGAHDLRSLGLERGVRASARRQQHTLANWSTTRASSRSIKSWIFWGESRSFQSTTPCVAPFFQIYFNFPERWSWLARRRSNTRLHWKFQKKKKHAPTLTPFEKRLQTQVHSTWKKIDLYAWQVSLLDLAAFGGMEVLWNWY